MYVKFKEMTKDFKFSQYMKTKELPGYIKHYVYDDEEIWVGYRTTRDHGVFTDKKLVLFDSLSRNAIRKKIVTIPYSSIVAIAVSFESIYAEFELLLNNGHHVSLTFLDLEPIDKVRIRILYTCNNRVISGQEPKKEDVEKLMKNDVSFK